MTARRSGTFLQRYRSKPCVLISSRYADVVAERCCRVLANLGPPPCLYSFSRLLRSIRVPARMLRCVLSRVRQENECDRVRDNEERIPSEPERRRSPQAVRFLPGCAIRSGPIRRLETRLSFRVRLGKRERPAEPPRSWFLKSRDLLSGVVS
jgi:hypothetical protein